MAVDEYTQERTKHFLGDIKENVRQNMLKKLDPTVPWNYVVFPSHFSPSEQLERIAKMREFLMGEKFDDFYRQVADAMSSFSQEDSDSFGSEVETLNVVKLRGLFKLLEHNGFLGVHGRSVNFWTGNEAKKKAYDTADECSDSEVPAICAMFDIAATLQAREYAQLASAEDYHLAKLFPEAISKYFATHVENNEVVNVYLSSDKEADQAGLQVGTYFWNTEMSVILKMVPHDKIVLHVYDRQQGTWEAMQMKHIPLHRRNAHDFERLVGDTAKFADAISVRAGDGKVSFPDWCRTAPARESLPSGEVRNFANKWRQMATGKRKQTEKEEDSDSSASQCSTPVYYGPRKIVGFFHSAARKAEAEERKRVRVDPETPNLT